MALMEFFGCLMLAFGPPLTMFVITVANDPVRVIVLMTSAFFWLLSLLLSSLLWLAVVPLKGRLEFALFFSVLFQEAFRYVFYVLLSKAEKGLLKMQKTEKKSLAFDKRVIAYVSGLGFGIISGAFAFVNVLNDMTGPGTIGIKGHSQAFFIVSSLLTLCFIFLHTCWSIIMYLLISSSDSAKSPRMWFGIIFVVASHLLASGITLINDAMNPNTYAISVGTCYALLAVNAFIAVYSVKNSYVRRISS